MSEQAPIPAHPQIVEKVLTEAIEESKTLQSLLEQEKKALENNQLESFTEILNRKTSALGRIEAFQNLQSIWLKEKALSHDPKDVEQFYTQFEGALGKKIAVLWTSFKKELSICERQNIVVGQLIAASKGHMEQLIDTLFQGSSSRVYQKDASSVNTLKSTTNHKA